MIPSELYIRKESMENGAKWLSLFEKRYMEGIRCWT